MEDNTEKREVNVANGLNVVDDVDVHTKPDAQSFIHLPNLQPVRAIFGFSSKINCLFAQVILNSRQDRRSQGPPLPPDVLARIQVVNGHPSKDPLVPVLSHFLPLTAHHRHPQPATVAQRSKTVWTGTSDLSRPSEESQVRPHPANFELLLELGCVELELKKLFSE